MTPNTTEVDFWIEALEKCFATFAPKDLLEIRETLIQLKAELAEANKKLSKHHIEVVLDCKDCKQLTEKNKEIENLKEEIRNDNEYIKDMQNSRRIQ